MKTEFEKDILQQNILLTEITKELKTKNQDHQEKVEALKTRNVYYSIIIKELQNDKKALLGAIGKPSLKKQSESWGLTVMAVTVILVSTTMVDNSGFSQNHQTITGNHVIENLRGDIQKTWKVWNIPADLELVVNIINSDMLTSEQKRAVYDSILSTKYHDIDNMLLHKGPEGTYSRHYVGWAGALLDASNSESLFAIPINIKIIESNNSEGNILIHFTSLKDGDGYSGFTKSIVDGNQILKSTITIYDIDSISNTQLETILRHEFGHALGLGHSTAPEDLMAPTIETDFPFISPCNVAAITMLYNGQTTDEVTCQI